MYLQAKKALRALKSLVKLQALVRGYLVRKQAATTLRRLQALMRVQAKTASSRKSIEQVRNFDRDILAMTNHISQDHQHKKHAKVLVFVLMCRSGLLRA